MPHRFELPAAEVERAYLIRAAALHPDLAGGTGNDSAALNDAKETLLNSELRANALLEVLGGPGKGQDRSLPEGFLVEVMEVREAAGAAGASESGRWRAWAVEKRRGYERDVGAMFAAVAGDRGLLREVRRTLNAWRYIERMIEQLDSGGDA